MCGMPSAVRTMVAWYGGPLAPALWAAWAAALAGRQAARVPIAVHAASHRHRQALSLAALAPLRSAGRQRAADRRWCIHLTFILLSLLPVDSTRSSARAEDSSLGHSCDHDIEARR